MKFYSHPGKLLKEHLKEVGRTACKFIENPNIRGEEVLCHIAYVIGLCHDFGKYTSFFQNYLLHGEDSGPKSHHSLLSALFATEQVEKYLKKEILSDRKINKFMPLLTYFVIHRHHGDLRSPEEIIPTWKWLSDYPKMSQASPGIRTEVQSLRHQIEDLRKDPRFSALVREMQEIGITDVDIFLNEKKILETFERLDLLRYELIERKELSEKDRLELYFLSLLLFSSLIDADKRLAAKVSEVSRKDIPQDVVDSYIKEHFKNHLVSKMNKMRNEIYQSVLKKIADIPLDNRILTLTAPTGSGKTLTALSTALKLRERIIQEKNYKPHIIYCLPFVNIIEQNYDVFYNVLSLISGFEKDHSAYLLKHHHLSNLEYKVENENKPLDEALLLTESWESEIIITTFVQFLHTIIGFKNKFLKKMHNIAGSIVILDEIQSIPVEYWNLTGKVLWGLTEILGCTIIQMTATRPLIFSKEESIELLDNNEKYFQRLDRVVLRPSAEEISEREFTKWFVSRYSNQKSYLIVTNTIRISINIYNALKDGLKGKIMKFVEIDSKNGKEISNDDLIRKFLTKTQPPIVYLSTNIIPKHRRKRVEFLQEFLFKDGKPILVATQVVEAGVDLDFQEVIRDIGPLDSIVQVAGRCNRNDNPQKGKVMVIKLSNGGADRIYGKVHPFIASKLLGDRPLEEKYFHTLVEHYFQEIKPRISDKGSREIWKAILNLCFYHEHYKSVSDFQLIEEKGDFADIFVEIDKEAIEIREKFYKEVLTEKSFRKRREAFLYLRKSFRDHILSTRIERAKKNPPPKMECGDMHFIPLEELQKYYDLETGYKEGSETFIW